MGYSPWGHKTVGDDLATKQQQHVHMSVHIIMIYKLMCLSFLATSEYASVD